MFIDLCSNFLIVKDYNSTEIGFKKYINENTFSENIKHVDSAKKLSIIEHNLSQIKRVVKSKDAAHPLVEKIKSFKSQINKKKEELIQSSHRSFSEKFTELKLLKPSDLHSIDDLFCDEIKMTKLLPKMDPSLFLHINGDAFGVKSGYEGYSISSAVGFLHKFLDIKSLKSMANALNRGVQFHEFFQNSFQTSDFCMHQKWRAAQFSKKLAYALSGNQGPILMQGGWFRHAIYFEIVPQADGRFTFRVFNTGEGLPSFHADLPVDGKQKYRCFYEVTDVEKEKLLNPTFLRAWIEIRSFSKEEEDGSNRKFIYGSTKYGAADIYEGLLQMLDGKVSPPNLVQEQLMGAQRAGTCTWKGLCAWMKNYLSHKEFKRLKWELKQNSLLQFREQMSFNEKEYLYDPAIYDERMNLWKKAVEKFARSCLKLKDGGIISQDEFAKSHILMSTIAYEIDTSDTKTSTLRELNAISPKFENKVASTFKLEVNTPIFTVSDDITAAPITKNYASLKLHDVENWNPAVDTIVGDLNRLFTQCETAYQQGEYEALTLYIHALVTQLPLLPFPSEFWKCLSVEDRKKVIQYLDKFGTFLFKSRFYLPDSLRDNPVSSYCMTKLCALIDQMVFLGVGDVIWMKEKRYLFSTHSQFPHSRVSSVIGELKNPDFRLLNPRQSEELLQLGVILKYPSGEEDQIVSQGNSACDLNASRHYRAKPIPHTIDDLDKDMGWKPEFGYLLYLLNSDVDYRERLRSKYPGFEKMSRKEQLAIAYEDEELLPDSYRIARRMGLQTFYMATGPFVKPVGDVKEKLLNILYECKPTPRGYIISHKIEGIGNEVNIKYPHFNPLFKEGNKLPIADPELSKLLSEYPKALTASGYPYHDPKTNFAFYQPFSMENQYMGKDPQLSKMSIERYRELSRLFTATNTQVVETISYFKRNPILLENQDYRSLFLFFLFETGNLPSELKNYPPFAVKLSEFVQFALSNFKDYGKVESVVFMLQISRLLESHVKYIRQQNPKAFEGINPVFSDVAKELRALLRLTSLSEEQKSIIHQALIASHLQDPLPLSDTAVEDILSSHFHLNKHPIPSNMRIPYFQDDVEKTMLRSENSICSYLMTNSGQDFLSQLASDILKEPKSLSKWTAWEAVPIYERDDGKCALNILEGRLYTQDAKPISLPFKVTHDSQYRTLFSKEYKARSLGYNTFEFEDEQGNLNRIEIRKEQILFFRQFEGQYFQFIPHSSLLKEGDQNQVTSSIGSLALVYNHEHWVNKEPLNKMLICKKGRPSPIYQSVNVKEGLISLQKIASQKVLSNIYTKASDDIKLLARFEETAFTHVWSNDLEQIDSIELSRFGLSFSIKEHNGNKIALCNQVKGFRLAHKQYIPSLGIFKNYLVLENERGDKKVLLPQQAIREKLTKSALNPHIMLDRLETSATPQSYYVVDVHPQTGELHSKQTAANLYMGMLYLGVQDYARAQMFFEEKSKKLGAYTLEEQKVLEWAYGLQEKNQDESAHATALRLRIGLIRYKNAEKLDLSTGSLGREQKTTYESYLNLHNNVTTFKLSTFEENQIRNIIESIETFTMKPISSQTIDSQAIFQAFEAVSSAKSKQTYLFTRPGDGFIHAFFDNYAIARSSKNRGKDLLVAQLRFVRNDPHYSIRVLGKILEGVLTNPDRYPHLAEMQKMMNEKDVQALQENVLQHLETPSAAQITHKLTALPPVSTNKNGDIQSVEIEPPVAISNQHSAVADKFKNAFKKVPKDVTWHHLESIKNAFFDSHQELMQSDRVSKQEFERLKTSCQTYLDTEKEASEAKINLDLSYIDDLTAELSLEIPAKEVNIKELEGAIIYFANHKGIGSRLEVERCAKQKNLFTIDDLLVFFGRKDFDKILQSNPHLSKDDIYDLNNKIAQLLVERTHLQRLQRAKNKLSTLAVLHRSQEDNSVVISDLVRDIHSELYGKRKYNISRYPAYLVFEYAINIALRQDQIEKLDEFLMSGNAQPILQMMMGTGKSTVLARLLALLFADKEHLAMVIFPEALYESAGEDFRANSQEVFRQPIVPLHFDRKTPCTVDKLQGIRNTLQDALDGQKCILATNKTLGCIYDRYIELESENAQLDKGEMPSAELTLMREIRSLLTEKTHVLFDEVDLILNCRHEVNFTVGVPDEVKKERIDLVLSLHRIFSSNKTIQELVKHEIAKDENKKAKPFTKETYHSIIKAILIRELVKTEAAYPFTKLLAEKEDLLIQYLSGKPSTEALKHIAHIPSVEVKHLLAVAAYELNIILPLTLDKNIDLHYGFSDNPNQLLAVPYIAGNVPNPTSEFGNLYELINYTIQAYKISGIPSSLIANEITNLQNQAISQMGPDHAVQLDQTAAYTEFIKLTGGKDNLHLFHMNSGVIEKLTTEINSNQNLQDYFIKFYILSKIKIFPKKISCNPQNLVSMFAKVMGFTGTLYNYQSFHPDLDPRPEHCIDGKTWFLLKTECEGKIYQIEDCLPKDKVAQIFLQHPHLEKFDCFIDTGGFFKGIKNIDVAQEILKRYFCKKRTPPLNAVVFYNEKNELMILERNKIEPIPIHESTLPLNERFVYYDQNHTTGANIIQHPQAKGIVFIGKTTFLRDIWQSVWRLRSLGRGQSVEFIISSEISQIIRDHLKLASDDIITLDHLILFALNNQSKQVGEDNPLARIQKLNNIVQKAVSDVMLTDTIPEQAKRNLFVDLMDDFFLISVEDLPFDQYGIPESLEDAEIILQETTSKFIKKVHDIIQKHPVLAQFINESSLAEKIREIDAKAIVPEKIARKASQSENLTVEKESEQKVEKQTTKQQEKEVFSISENDSKALAAYAKWEKDIYDPTFFDNVETQIPLHMHSRDTKTVILPCISASDALLKQKELSSFSTLFDEKLKVTPDLLATFADHYLKPNLFHNHQKIALQYCVRINNETGEIELFMLSQFAFAQLKAKLAEEFSAQKSANSLYSICIYDSELGIVQQGKEKMADAELQKNPIFMKLLVQAKFFNGETHFNKEELPILNEWITEKNSHVAKALFLDHIIRFRDTCLAQYQSSVLKEACV